MEESEDNMSVEDIRLEDGFVKTKSKKRSLVERELETNLTARVTSPILNRDATSTSRYGRARRLKTEADFCDTDKAVSKCLKSPKHDVAKSPSKIQSPVYKMHASNSPIRVETPKKPESSLVNQIESIYNENISLSRFGSEEKKSVAKKFPKVYIRKDLIQTKEKEMDDTVVLIKNIFSPNKSITKSNKSFNFESSTEKNYSNKSNGYMNTLSVVKTLDFDGNKKKKRDEKKSTLSKSELFDMEAKSEYQVGDLAWARMGTYPFWPCIITRDPLSGLFVKKKLFGRIERDVMHVTFFGDNGRRGWIVDSMLRKFLGQLEFETARMNFTIEAKKKDHRFYAAFFISEKKTPQWQISVEEAEALLKEPKRLRIDILNDMINKSRALKTTPKLDRGRKVTRTNSDVSLSESLYDTLFSEDDSKVNETERSRSRNRSLDVSEVVTACLDNMAAKTGIIKIQRQSHMDRWLQKAKSKTPEKSHYKSQAKESSSNSKKKSKDTTSRNESLNKLHNDHDYSQKHSSRNSPIILDEVEIEYNNAEIFNIEPGSGIGIISKVETLCGKNDNNEILDNVIFENASIEQINPVESSLQSELQNLNTVNMTNEINKNTPSIYSKIPDVTDNNILDNIFATDDSSSDMDTNNESIDMDSSNNQSIIKISNFNNVSENSISEEKYESNRKKIHEYNELNTDVNEINENNEQSTIKDVEEMDLMQLEVNTNSIESNASNLDSTSSSTANINILNEGKHETKAEDNLDDVNIDNNDTSIESNTTLELENEISELLGNIVENVKCCPPIDNIKTHKTRYKLSLKKSTEKTNSIDSKKNNLTNRNNLNINELEIYNQLENGQIDNNLVECVDIEKLPVIISSEDITTYGKDNIMILEPLPSNDIDVQNVCDENKKNKPIEDMSFEDFNNLKDITDATDQINYTPKDTESETQVTKTDDLNSCNSNKLEIEILTKINQDDDSMSINTLSDLNEELNQEVLKFSEESAKEIDKDDLKESKNESNQEMDIQNDIKVDDEINNKFNSQDVLQLVDESHDNHKHFNIQIEKDQKDDDNLSVKSEGSEVSLSKRRRGKEKSFLDKKNVLDPEFLKYLELRQDAVMDDHPDLSQDDIINYLYKTWLYEESLKPDKKKTDDIDQANLVKGLKFDPAPATKKVRKKIKIEKEVAEEVIIKEKSKRKIIRPLYKEDFSDGDDSIEYFEIFKSKKGIKSGLVSDIKPDILQTEGAVLERIINVDEYMQDEYDDVEEYFTQLTAPKANVFKGYIREKVCEICEKVGNLVKCKGCHSMFHIECDKKEIKVIECPTPTRGRKKKKKTRGRKPKDDLGHDSGSDEKSQEANVSEELLNMSVEEESHIIANADDFEALLSANMQEILKDQNIKYDFYSREELDWNDTHIGECKIVDIKPRIDSIELADYSEFKCKNCLKYDPPVCFVCKYPISPKEKQADRQKCQVAHCNKYYHLECLDHWPQTQFTHSSQASRTHKFCEALSCPRHVCHTCVCDDPRGCKTRFSGDKLARCVRCPATYHTFTKCLPAGTQILTASHIICPRHYEHRPGKVPCHVNTGWCFICALGGSLICCEYCPTSFHAECLNIKPPEGGYMCEDCETGRLPLYGEMVWVKLGHYRWWPGIILHPSEIPDNILAVRHTLGEFVVRFFGQYDYYWVNRGRVFPFQEGDSGKVSTQRSKIDAAFTMAMEHAQRACEILKSATPNEEESSDIASSLLPPHYVKLKVNKPCGSLCGKKIDLEESSLTQCECDPNDVEPCGPYTQCLNRMLLTECGPLCRAGDRCNNRAFEKRLYPRLEPYRTPQRGWGLRAVEDIRAGRFVIEYVGELLDEDEFRRRMSRKHEVRDENFYFLTLDKERMIDAGPKGNLARFMNHSCEPNCETQKWTVLGDVRVGLFAICDIPANTELTFNYNLETSGIEKKRCMCGAKRCSGYIGAKPKQEDQPKKLKPQLKRTYKKRKVEDSPSTSQYKKRGRPLKPRELTDIEKDLLIIKNATNGLSSDSESSRLSVDSWKDSKALKRKRINLSTEEMSPKRVKSDEINNVY